jgi:hypothetical protein
MYQVSSEMLGRVAIGKHFLSVPAARDEVVGVVERVCGLNAQTARAPYLSLWNRVDGFKKNRLRGALYVKKALIKAWLMRGTVHIVSTRDFSVYQNAVGRKLAGRWRQQMEKMGFSLSAGRRRELHDRIVRALTEQTLTKIELLPRVEERLGSVDERERKRNLGYALRELSYLGLVCHAEPTGPWYYFGENRFSSVEKWSRDDPFVEIGEAEARTSLLRKYLQGYGPASVRDFAYWAGFSLREARDVFEALRDGLQEIVVEGSDDSVWMLKDDLGSLDEADSRGQTPIRLLPEFDSLIMGHRDKARIMDEKDRKKVFLRLADVAPTLLVDGRVAGVWKHKMSDHSFSLDLFREGDSLEAPKLKAAVAQLQSVLEAE